MPDSVAALILAAGGGTRLRPLTLLRPKVLCPVAGVPLVDHALERVACLVGAGPSIIAVNVHHHAEVLAAHVEGRAHVSRETGDEALGTAGAVGALRPWLDGRSLLVVNGDTWSTASLGPLLDDWDGERVRVAVLGPPGTPLVPGAPIVGSIVPAADAARIPAEPLGLSNGLWWPALDAGRLDVVNVGGEAIPCDRPAGYLSANLAASGGASVVGEGATVEGTLVRSVVWPGARVRRREVLVDAIRASDRMTVLVR
ncbi:MAG TPA: sugar phosphate nucleotidyltransferase [Acidimicrobiales bacterium]|nr:sugar phosphate nucleotidyltransferase [Acidimicrobiales bacterium]